MSDFTKNTEDLDCIKKELPNKQWLVACLCAGWCDTCQAYRTQFDALATKHPDKCFAWIDIEDQADLVDELDIENFPTILIEFKNSIEFFGTMLPDALHLDRLLTSFTASIEEDGVQKKIARSNSLNQDIPIGWNLRKLILQHKK